MTVTTNYLVTGNGITGSTANAVASLVSQYGIQSLGIASLLNRATISHRGGAGQQGDSTAYRPGTVVENSLQGYKAAIQSGQRLFETDVRLDSQGTAWVFHDPTVAAAGKGLITDAASDVDILTLTTAEVRALNKLGASNAPGWPDSKILTLDELIEEFGRDAVFIYEAKAALLSNAQETARVIVNRLQAHSVPRDYAFISSSDASVISAVAGAYPGLRYLSTMAGRTGAQVAADKATGAVAISADAGWDAAQVALVQSYGLAAILGTCRRLTERDAFYAIGGDATFSDEPLYFMGRSPIIWRNWFSGGKWPHGCIPNATNQGGRGLITIDGKYRQTYLNSSAGRSMLLGHLGRVSGNWQLDFTLRWDAYVTGATNAGVWLTVCSPTDVGDDMTAAGNNSMSGLPNRFAPGVNIKLRRNQNYQVYRNEATGLTQTLLAEKSAGSALTGAGTAVTDTTDQTANAGTGTAYVFRITKVGTTISVFNITQDGAVTPGVTVTDASVADGYMHIGRANATFTIEGATLTAL